MGFRHFWENPHCNIFSEARAAKKNGRFFERNIIFFATLIFSPPPFASSYRPRSEFFEQYNGVEGQFLGKFCAHISAPPPNSFAHSSPHGAILKARPIRTGRYSLGEDICSNAPSRTCPHMLGTASPPAACCPCAPSTSIGVGFRAASSARLRTRARSPQTHQAAAIRKTQRGSRHLTIGHLVERVVVRIARSSLPVEELELVAPLADHCYAHAVRALPPAQTTLLRSCQLSDSSRCFVRPAGFGVHWSSCRRFATMAEPSGGSRARATRCSAASSGTMYRVACGATSIASFAWDIGRRDARSLGTNDGYVLRLGQMQKDRNDSFYNLPPPNSLNRRGVAILM